MPESAQSAQSLMTQDAERMEFGGAKATAPPCLATIQVAADGDRVHVRMDGELDFGGQGLLPELNEALDHSASGVDLDLSEVGFCDCSGLNVLLALRQRALDQGKTVAVTETGRPVERLLDLTGARELLVRPGPTAAGTGTLALHDGHAPRGEPDRDVDQELRTEVAELRRAMQTRPAIDLARGILMASFNLTPEAAWTVLVASSQNTNTKLHRLAQDLVGTVQGTPLPKEVQQQLAAAVAQARAVAKAPPA